MSAGTLRRFEAFPSRYIQPRNVDVWLPEGYDPRKRYPVLYMHDGQMLFDSSATWNKQEWGVDETADSLVKAGSLQPFIVVGIWNNGKYRHAEYFPQRPIAFLPRVVQDSLIGTELMQQPKADDYLRFLTRELKPFIDSAFSTRRDRKSTAIGGSSMGGLISMYAICEYPQVFGTALCLSTHWPGSVKAPAGLIPAAFVRYLQQKLPDPATHRIYFDLGTATLDSLYPPYQKMADAVMKAKGYTRRNWVTHVFRGEDHTERAWRRRLYLPFLFFAARPGR